MVEHDEKRTVWFVQDGQMHSSWIIGHMDINVEVEPTENYTKPVEVAANVLTGGALDSWMHDDLTRDTKLFELAGRPGRWFYLSGSNVVHSDDLYGTREEAAEAYKNFLLNE